MKSSAPPETNTATASDTAGRPAGAENDIDRGIRRELDLAIRSDPYLKDRGIKFSVVNGDVSVTGIVKDEHERGRINALAMDITGVKSVANGLLIAE